MAQIFTHRNISMKFEGKLDEQFAISRVETADCDSTQKRSISLKAPYALRTAGDNCVNMEGCGGFVPGAGGKCTEITETDDCLVLKYLNGDLETIVKMEYIKGADVIRQTNSVKNIGKENVLVTHFSSCVVPGICMDGILGLHDKRKIVLHHCLSHWQGEAQWVTDDLEHVGIYHKTAHAWDAMNYVISSVGSWSTGRHYPIMIVEDKECGKVWYIELEGAYNWAIEIGNQNGKDGGTLYLEANCADENFNGFNYELKPGEVYTAPSCIFGCTDGGFEEAVHEMLKYKRLTSIGRWDKPYAPACFNDYMDCLWAKPSGDVSRKLVDAAAKAGCELFCMDAGWYTKGNGEWSVNDEKFGEGGFAGFIKYVADKGMIPGVWLEVESVFPDTMLYKKDMLVQRHGKIVNPSRPNVDFENKEARDYIIGIFDMLYDTGVRFIKNDYNLSIMIGAENYGTCFSDGERRSIDAFYSLIDEVKAKHPDMKIENCGSGAMRCDNGTLRHFELQSTSDQEFYYYNSSIISGSLGYLAPEKAGVWSFPYPQSFYESQGNINVWENKDYRAKMADGEETVYNMVNALCGTLYLSGRIEYADKKNFALVKEGVKAFKKYRAHNASSYPVWPCGHFTMADKTYSALGLMAENKKKMTLAVWRRNSTEDTLMIDLSKYTTKKSTVKLAYPSDPMGAVFAFNPSSGILSVKLPKTNSARFFEISI